MQGGEKKLHFCSILRQKADAGVVNTCGWMFKSLVQNSTYGTLHGVTRVISLHVLTSAILSGC